MSWLDATGRLASQLRVLVSTPQEFVEGEVSAPAAACAAVTRLVQRVHGDLVVLADETCEPGHLDDVPTWRKRFDRLVAVPVSPHLNALATDDSCDSCATNSAAADVWRRATRSARVAAAEWEASRRDSRPSGPATTAAFADLASLVWASATAFVNATGPLSTVLRRTELPVLTAAAAEARTTAHVARQAIRGFTSGSDVQGYTDLREDLPRVPISVHEPQHLARALKRLAHIVASADTLAPQTVAQVAGLHRIATTHLGDAIVRTGQAADHAGLMRVGAALRQHAQKLVIGPEHVAGVRTIIRVDGTQTAALNQASAIARAAEALTPLSTRSVGHLLRAAFDVPDVTVSLAVCVRSNIASGHWLRPAGTEAFPPVAPSINESTEATNARALLRRWQRTMSTDDLPMATELEQAARDAEHLRAALPGIKPKPAREVLSELVTRPRRGGIVTAPELGPSF